jgi:hypothetical protein
MKVVDQLINNELFKKDIILWHVITHSAISTVLEPNPIKFFGVVLRARVKFYFLL